MTQIDIKNVASLALDRVDKVLTHWVPDGSYQGAEYVALNPSRPDSTTGSFSINRNTGAWADFADDQKGGDLVALVAYLDGVSQIEACKRLAAFLGLGVFSDMPPPKERKAGKGKAQAVLWKVIMPVPYEAIRKCPDKHYKNGEPSAVWAYFGLQGELLMKVMRFDISVKGRREKDYRPLPYCVAQDGSDKAVWRWQQPPRDRPLYGLDRLGSSEESPVLLVEGEKASDAAVGLLPGYVSMSWSGGSKALSKTDFSPLAGRRVVLWPDNDQAGIDCMAKLAGMLKSFDCEVSTVDLSVFGERWPNKADAADAESLGFGAEWLRERLSQGALFLAPSGSSVAPGHDPDDQGSACPSAFVVNDKGVYFQTQDSDGEPSLIRLCDRLDVMGHSRARKSVDWGLLVRFTDPDGIVKDLNITREHLATEGGGEVLRQLYSRGLMAEAGQQPRRRLIQYLQTANPAGRYTLVNTLGWHGDGYLTPAKTYGNPKEPLYFYDDSGEVNKMSQRGSLDSWKTEVAQYCVGNPRLAFAVSAAFAGPLLDLVGMDTVGFHFHGDSSLGKSTLLSLSGSVCGAPDYQYKWRATDNALEGIAAAHNDGLLLLDEMSQCSASIVGDVAYMLGNGRAKARANDRGGAKSNPVFWRLVYLSSGEVSLAQHMGEVGKKAKAGQEVRLLSIPADAGVGHGVFNELHGYASGKALSEQLTKIAVREHYGEAFGAFMESLCSSDLKRLARMIREEFIAFSKEVVGKDQSQVGRAANGFALVGFAGELASHAGITGWPKGVAKEAAKEIFSVWVGARGGTGNLENQQILSQVKLFFELYGESKFTRWDRDDSTVDDHNVRTMMRCGYRKSMQDSNALDDSPCTEVNGSACSEITYYVTPEAFKAEICGSYSLNKVKTLLADCDALEKDNQGGYTKPVRLPGGGRKAQRVYVIRPHMIPSFEDAGECQEVA